MCAQEMPISVCANLLFFPPYLKLSTPLYTLYINIQYMCTWVKTIVHRANIIISFFLTIMAYVCRQERTAATAWSQCRLPNWCPCRAPLAGPRWPATTALVDTIRCRPWTRPGSAHSHRSYRPRAWVARWARRRPPTTSPGKHTRHSTRHGTDKRYLFPYYSGRNVTIITVILVYRGFIRPENRVFLFLPGDGIAFKRDSRGGAGRGCSPSDWTLIKNYLLKLN